MADFGPSLSAFPTPVSFLIWNALPWTVGLLLVATLIAWGLGNLLGGLAGYYRDSRILRALGVIAMGFHPIPYYIVAFVLLIVFGYLWPVLPITGGYQMNMTRGFSLEFILSILRHSILPALSLVLVGVGGWFMGMRALVSNIVTEDYVVYAEYGGVDRHRILASYVMRNALAPQVTGLAHLPRRDLQWRDHHRAGVRLSRASARSWSMPSTPATTASCSASPRSRSSRSRSRCW